MMNVTGQVESDVKKLLIDQVTCSVRWSDTIETLRKAGIDRMIEVGPGKSLTMMNKKMKIENAYSVSEVKDLEVFEHAAS